MYATHTCMRAYQVTKQASCKPLHPSSKRPGGSPQIRPPEAVSRADGHGNGNVGSTQTPPVACQKRYTHARYLALDPGDIFKGGSKVSSGKLVVPK